MNFLAGIFLIAITFFAYLPSFKVPFQFDDYRTIVENHYLQIATLSPEALYHSAFQGGRDNRPVVNLSFALNYYLGGINPFGYHIVNFAFHLFTGVGIWLLFFLLLKSQGFEPFRSWLTGFLSALLWLVHPVNSQAVTYIVQRYSVMAGAFSIFSFVSFHLALEGKKVRTFFYLLSVIFCLSALLSKESALILPILLLLYKIYFFDRFQGKWLKANGKWIIFLIIFYVVAGVWFFRQGMLEQFHSEFQSRFFSFSERIYTEPKVLLWYLALILFPFPQVLSLLHDFKLYQVPWSFGFIIFSLLIVISLYFAIKLAKRQKLFSFAFIWYLGTLLIEALPLPIDLANEHRLYLASLSIIAPLIGYSVFLFRNPKWVVVWVLVLISFFSFFSFRRNLVWQSKVGLWRDTVLKAPKTSRGWVNYCYYLTEAGDYYTGIRICKLALAIDPKASSARNSLGICYFETGKKELAENQFLLAVELNPEESWAYFNLGRLYSLKGNYEESLKWYLKAIEKEPENAEAHYLLALCYEKLGKSEEFVREMKKADELRRKKLNPHILFPD